MIIFQLRCEFLSRQFSFKLSSVSLPDKFWVKKVNDYENATENTYQLKVLIFFLMEQLRDVNCGIW